MVRWAAVDSRDRVELRVVDESLANALFRGIPAARLLARVRLAIDGSDGSAWDRSIDSLLRGGSRDHQHVKRAVARHLRVALDEGPLSADEVTLAVLAWAVACDQAGRDASLAEIAPRNSRRASCDPETVGACALRDERLARSTVDKRAPAFEACVRLSTCAAIDSIAWEQLQAVAAHLERGGLGVPLLGRRSTSIFPRGVDDEIASSDRRVVVIDRRPLDSLVATDPRRLGAAVWRTEPSGAATAAGLTTFLSDLARLLAHDGTLVAALSPAGARARGTPKESEKSPTSSAPLEWTRTNAAHMADSLERGLATATSVQAAVSRGGEGALDAIGVEMLNVAAHPFASSICAQILARSARPRDVVRLVTYFAIAPDPEPAARALGACPATELPGVLGAWIETILPKAGENATESAAARIGACIASLRPYPRLYQTVTSLLPRLSPLC